MRTICFATNNEHKLEEVKHLLSAQYTIVSLHEIGCLQELPETQNTLRGNALQKADFVFQHYNMPCFADDTGLEVQALHGEPGVYSARYAGPQRNAYDNMQLLLHKLSGVTHRDACFKTVIALKGFGADQCFEGVVNGSITEKPMGTNGFGYDPVFKPNGYNITFAEMTMQEKNTLSHRALAIAQLVQFLEHLPH